MQEHHIEVAKTARYFTLGEAGPNTRELWIVCHGYRQLAKRFMRRFQSLEAPHRYIVAPEALSRFYLDDGTREHVPGDPIGATWMTSEDRLNEIADYVRYLDAVADEAEQALGGSAERLVVLGFSQGVHTACRWVAATERPVSRLICWGAYPPRDLDPDRGPRRLSETDVVLVRGRTDAHASEAGHRRQEEHLASLGIPSRTRVHEGGHDVDSELLLELAEAGG